MNSNTVTTDKHPPASKTQQNSFQPKFLIIDDDQIVTKVFKVHLQSHYPNAIIDTSNAPLALPGYDIYFLDNDFDGLKLATSLIKEIREHSPQSLVVSMSRTHSLTSMQHLINLGCNAVYSKNDLQNATEAREVISNYIEVLSVQNTEKRERRFQTLIRSIHELMRQWNQRLARNIDA